MSNKLKNEFLAKSISKLYLDTESSDVKFKFNANGESQFVPAHKAILGSESSVFYAMFFGPLKEGEIIEITDACAESFKEFIQFFYLPEVTITMENIVEVIRLADKYDMLDHLNMCITHLEGQLSDDNMFWGYQLAIELDNQQLKQFCDKKLAFLMTNIIKSDTFLHCEQQVLKHFLQMDQMFINEIDVFNACVAWAKSSCRKNGLDENNPSDLKKQLGDCFYLIRFGAMAKTDIGVIMSNERYTGLFERNELIDMLRITTIENYKSTLFTQKSRIGKSFGAIKSPELVCNRVEQPMGTAYFIHSKESTWFSSNNWLVLGEFSCPTLHKNYYENIFDINFSVSIIEHSTGTFETDIADKVVFTGTVNFSLNESAPNVIIPQAVPINPQKMYEIIFSTVDYMKGTFFKEVWQSMVKLDEDVEVIFYQNPTANKRDRSGLISTLTFKRI